MESKPSLATCGLAMWVRTEQIVRCTLLFGCSGNTEGQRSPQGVFQKASPRSGKSSDMDGETHHLRFMKSLL